MTLDFDTLAKHKRRSDAAARSLADKDTPFIRNAWYVAARSDEVSREPLARTILGSSVMLFRKQDGTAVALQNRCAHRSFPLAKGKVDGDTIVCGYHGLRYNCEGECIEVPRMERDLPAIAVRAYPVIERPPFVWLWTGDPAAIDESALPHPEWLGHPDWDYYIGYLNPNGSYVHMHENLLDLSHLSFLHETTFGTPEYAKAPVDISIEGTDIQVWREVECYLPAIYAKPLGWEGQKAIRRSGSRYVAPGLHVNTGILKNLERPESEQEPPPTVKVAQLLTPETQTSLHYYYTVCRNFLCGDDEVTDFMMKAQMLAFNEDVYALENLTAMHAQEPEAFFYELNIPTDRAGLEMKRHLKALADAERETAARAPGPRAATP